MESLKRETGAIILNIFCIIKYDIILVKNMAFFFVIIYGELKITMHTNLTLLSFAAENVDKNEVRLFIKFQITPIT